MINLTAREKAIVFAALQMVHEDAETLGDLFKAEDGEGMELDGEKVPPFTSHEVLELAAKFS